MSISLPLSLDVDTFTKYTKLLSQQMLEPRILGVLIPYGDATKPNTYKYPGGVVISINYDSKTINISKYGLNIELPYPWDSCQYIKHFDFDVDIRDNYLLISMYNIKVYNWIGTYLCDFNTGLRYKIADIESCRENSDIHSSFITYNGLTRVVIAIHSELHIYTLELEYLCIFDKKIQHTIDFLQVSIDEQYGYESRKPILNNGSELDHVATYGYDFKSEMLAQLKKCIKPMIVFIYKLDRCICAMLYDTFNGSMFVMVFTKDGRKLAFIPFCTRYTYHARIIMWDRKLFLINVSPESCYIIE